MHFNGKTKLLMGLGSGLVSIFSLMGFGGGFRMITNMEVSKLKILEPGTKAYELWETPASSSYLGFYFFNLTNAEEFSNGAKAILREMGPYIYRVNWQRKDVTPDSENGTLRYRTVKTFFFDDELTDGSETDRISIVNVMLIATASMARKTVEDKYLLRQLDKILTSKGGKLILTGTVRQLLFDGVPLPSYTAIFNNHVIKENAEDLGIDMPKEMKHGKFALLKNKNGTEEDWLTIKTGREDAMEAGTVTLYKDQSELDVWSDSSCNALNGTDGTAFPPHITKESILQVFSPAMCRSFNMIFHKDSKVSKTPTLAFATDQETWKAPKTNPSNNCFCPSGKAGEQKSCDRDGIVDVGPCSEGAPLLLSQPHFVGGEESLLQDVEGMEPDFEKHVSLFDLEPITGTLMKSSSRMQFNVELVPNEDMPTFAKVKRAIVPFVWTEETITAGEVELASLSSILLLDTIFSVTHFIFIGLGAVLIGQALIMAKKSKNHASPVKPFNNSDILKSGVSDISKETAFTY
ncbi:unnamed protein product [Allacma fusca]|uniref:Scavenger receptor class B member 1 n=1 Tax=Allacma fusca TaxID=39272 RepID=A0A8J2JVD6_9HEXA|nr:unnamed protein product [Allacma fusca]